MERFLRFRRREHRRWLNLATTMSVLITLAGLTAIQASPAVAAETVWTGTVKTDTQQSTKSGAYFRTDHQVTTYTLDGANSRFQSAFDTHSVNDGYPCASEVHDDYTGSGSGPYSYEALAFSLEDNAETHMSQAVLRGDTEHYHYGVETAEACASDPDGYHIHTSTSAQAIVVYPPISALGCSDTVFIVPTGIQAIHSSISNACDTSSPDAQRNASATWTYSVKLSPCDTAVDSDHDGMGDCDEFDHGRDPMNPNDADPKTDADGDGVPDSTDNCKSTPNTNQADLDGDHIGDACDADIDGDGLLNVTDPCPLDSTNSCDDPDFSCTSTGAQRKVFTPHYDAKVQLLAAPDIDLFHYDLQLMACWDGRSAAWNNAGSILGDTDGGLDEVILNQLGFDIEYDSSKQKISIYNSPKTPTAEVTAEFNFVFHLLKLLDKVGVKQKLEGKVESKVAKQLNTWLKKHNVTGPEFGDELRLQGKYISNALIDAAAKLRPFLTNHHVPPKIANYVADWVEGKIAKFAKQYRKTIGALSHQNAFQKLTADKMAKKLVDRMFEAIDPKVTMIVWRPNYIFSLSTTGTIAQSNGYNEFANPFLTVTRKD